MSSWAFGIEWNDTGLGDYTRAARPGLAARPRLRGGRARRHLRDAVAPEPRRVLAALQQRVGREPVQRRERRAARDARRSSSPTRDARRCSRGGSATSSRAGAGRRTCWRGSCGTRSTSRDGYEPRRSTAWHADMAALLRALDPNDHLVTTSHAFLATRTCWASGGLDFTQIHYYADTLPASRTFRRRSRRGPRIASPQPAAGAVRRARRRLARAGRDAGRATPRASACTTASGPASCRAASGPR